MTRKSKRWAILAFAGAAMLMLLACTIEDVTMNYDWQTATVEVAIETGGW